MTRRLRERFARAGSVALDAAGARVAAVVERSRRQGAQLVAVGVLLGVALAVGVALALASVSRPVQVP